MEEEGTPTRFVLSCRGRTQASYMFCRKDTLDSDGSSFTADIASVQQERDSPMASIQDVLADVLPVLDGSPFISGLYFQVIRNPSAFCNV